MVVTEVVLEETGVIGAAERDMAIVGFHGVYRKEDKELENVQGCIEKIFQVQMFSEMYH